MAMRVPTPVWASMETIWLPARTMLGVGGTSTIHANLCAPPCGAWTTSEGAPTVTWGDARTRARARVTALFAGTRGVRLTLTRVVVIVYETIPPSPLTPTFTLDGSHTPRTRGCHSKSRCPSGPPASPFWRSDHLIMCCPEWLDANATASFLAFPRETFCRPGRRGGANTALTTCRCELSTVNKPTPDR